MRVQIGLWILGNGIFQTEQSWYTYDLTETLVALTIPARLNQTKSYKRNEADTESPPSIQTAICNQSCCFQGKKINFLYEVLLGLSTTDLY